MIAWAKETLAAAAILQDAHSARQSHGRFTRDNRNLALAILDLPSLGRQSVKFIHWQIPGRTGRPVELDLQNRVKALVCWCFERSFEVGKLHCDPSRFWSANAARKGV